jgi:23S rRNA (adenine2030-N6)-methyltransferase
MIRCLAAMVCARRIRQHGWYAQASRRSATAAGGAYLTGSGMIATIPGAKPPPAAVGLEGRPRPRPLPAQSPAPMLSYRHGFHAGNHADVLKHVVLVQLLRRLTRKETPLWVIDTHAGAGSYSLESGYAARNAEFASGIGRLWNRPGLPAPLRDYVEQVRAANPDGVLRRYPGSPHIALQMLRPQDRLRCFELHPADSRLLQEHVRSEGRRVGVVAADGLAGLRALLPPPSRRGLVLIDPSYELAAHYREVRTALRDAFARFATGTYAVWFPQLQRREAAALPDQLQRLAPGDWLRASLTIAAPAPGGFGMHGSGVFVVNPPWGLETALNEALPALARLLGQDATASFDLAFRQT